MNPQIEAYLQSRPRSLLILFASIATGLVWVLDIATGPYLSTSIFYLVPITFASWWIGRRAGLAFSLLGAIAWLITDLTTNPGTPNALIPFWNAGVRLGFFVVVSYALTSLRRAEQRKQELTSFVVHDLRSPLSNMIMGLDLLKGTPEIMGDEIIERLVESGLASGRRMLVLINSLLDLARLEDGKMPVKLEALPIDAITDQAAAQVVWMAQRYEVNLDIQLPTAGASVRADRELLTRVLVNLLSNAIKFSHEGDVVQICVEPAEGGVTVTVHDDGPGIPAAWQKRVFHKFAQIEARKAGAATGSGLGLAFCKLAVEAQLGRIWLEPVERGTTISLWLPDAP